ncbi:C-type lectin lectoxin-Lio3 [Austrofundulus limnaeus]|uniref:C-type lectin lectoxin-Lio3 n=1 Tax=Austrofundulus limnaeus TaxID=52670 RepID=A0A2I4BQD8_AUSLI|nr:PREDICTED: C-type lectin lectoxin-Lio3-like [Austrofundulus limnaeus]
MSARNNQVSSVRIITVGHPLSWEDALNYCEAYHTRFLWIEDGEDQNAVEQWLKYSNGSGNYNEKLWIGLRQSSVFGFWIWSDRIVNWNNWRDNRIPELSPAYSHCGVINVNGTWGAEDCRKAHPFLCEEEISYMDE